MNALNTLKEVENGGKQEAKEPKIRKKQFEVLPFHCNMNMHKNVTVEPVNWCVIFPKFGFKITLFP